MLINKSSKTNWFHLLLIVGATIVSFYFIKEALAKTFIQWEAVNDEHFTEIKAMLEE